MDNARVRSCRQRIKTTRAQGCVMWRTHHRGRHRPARAEAGSFLPSDATPSSSHTRLRSRSFVPARRVSDRLQEGRANVRGEIYYRMRQQQKKPGNTRCCRPQGDERTGASRFFNGVERHAHDATPGFGATPRASRFVVTSALPSRTFFCVEKANCCGDWQLATGEAEHGSERGSDRTWKARGAPQALPPSKLFFQSGHT